MSGILNSGKLSTLLDRLTATRAGYLDAAISSRASATHYTSTRAAKLDYLDQAISSISSPSEIPGTLVSGTEQIDFDPGGAGSPASLLAQAGLYTTTVSSSATLLSVSGEGYIEFLSGIYNSATSGGNYLSMTLAIDGSTVWTQSTGLPAIGAYSGYCPVGSIAFDATGYISGLAFSRMRFSTGFTLTSSATTNWLIAAKYYTV
jgi:hypothetical protein